MSLQDFLENKPLYYKEIDIHRFPVIWHTYKSRFKLPKIIHVIGTNGKGSTGRFLAHHLYKNGLSTGHYTSPHIMQFNERIWLNGTNASDQLLETHHQKLQNILSKEDLEAMSYFEYTTLLAISVYEKCDFIVLEAGLGGEFDATSVFDNDLTLVTPVGIDHESFLGDTIEKIAKTKLKAVRKFAILGKQDKRVYKIAKEMGRKNKVEFFRYGYFFTKDEISRARRMIRTMHLPEFFVDNLLLALAAVKFFGYDVHLKSLMDITLFGRAQKITPNVTIDVGHNPLAAKALVNAFKRKKIVLVYNSYADKDYVNILKILSPVVKRVEILSIYHERVEDRKILEEAIVSCSLAYTTFTEISSDEEYLVFGSFAVVEEFLKHHVKAPIS